MTETDQRLASVTREMCVHYRLYTLDGEDKIVLASDYDCETDQEAIALAQGIWAGGGRAEIWRSRKKLELSLADSNPPVQSLPDRQWSDRRRKCKRGHSPSLEADPVSPDG